MKWRVLASACAAAMAVTSLPYMATQVNAEPAAVTQQTGDNDLKLWYTSPADITKYYEGWQEKSLPIGNGAIGGTVFGGITRERIQLNDKSLWSGGPSTSRPNYNGGNLENKGNNGATMTSIHNYFANGQDSSNQFTNPPSWKNRGQTAWKARLPICQSGLHTPEYSRAPSRR